MKKLITRFTLIFFPIFVCALEQYNDISLQIDTVNYLESSYLKVNSIIYEDVFDHSGAIILNPKFFARANNSHAFSMSIGYRHQVGNHAFGNHVFWNTQTHENITDYLILNQYGFSMDWIHRNFEFRVNYYLPNTTIDNLRGMDFNIPHLIESELLIKTPWFHVGVGPNYSATSKEVGFTSRMVVPFDRFYCGVYYGSSWTGNTLLYTSFGYNFGENPSPRPRHARVHHSPTVSYERGITCEQERPKSKSYNKKSDKTDEEKEVSLEESK